MQKVRIAGKKEHLFCQLLVANDGDEQMNGPDEIDPHAEPILRRFSEWLRCLKNFRVEVIMTVNISIRGMTIPKMLDTKHVLTVERPNRIALRLTEGKIGTTVICDGKKIYKYWGRDEYSESDAPATLDDIVISCATENAIHIPEICGPRCIDVLICANPYERLTKGVSRIDQLDTDEVDGVECHHIKLLRESYDCELWIEVGDDPLLRQFVPDESQRLEQAVALNPVMKDMTIESSVNFKNWQVNVDLPEDEFRFVPPEGAEIVDEQALYKKMSTCEKCGQPADVHESNVVSDGTATQEISSHHFCRACADAEGSLEKARRFGSGE